ncbi:MGH1-like glycoside hydrolase domain-containing protein [Granulicella arctica]|uniref:Putative isomerase n=1 Tax=Granulicella arctica TaxID=940613 RepID=A0A7Y9THP7_9BACT|nr:trehalase family glycosidase [Granulicella arctica]NYF80784.1 putative isomerase [Granulicella arctica]
MTLISRRNVLAGLAASSVSSIATARHEQRHSSAASNVVPLSSDERRRHADALLRYFAANAPQMLRAPDGILKHPSIAQAVPGKTYSAQLWDWDTLWTSQGLFRLAALEHDESLKQKLCEHVSGSLLNFLDHASPTGQLPIMMTADNPDAFRIVAQNETSRNQAKPVFGQLGLLACDQRGDVKWLEPHFDSILRFYDSWVKRNSSTIGLLVWGDDVAIGDDNDPTTFGRPFFSSANLLLNCLFYQDLLASAELARRLGRSTDHDRLSRQAEELAQRIQMFCWDPRDSYYYTVDVQCVDRRAELIPTVPRGMDMSWRCLPIRIQMFTGFLPLWCGIASQENAQNLVRTNYLADDRLRAQSGVRSLSNRETMYSLDFSSNPSNWLGPVWIIANYFVWKALQRYGFKKEADELADKTIRLLSKDLETNGSLNEYYHPDTGAALSHKGYITWNLLVLEMI